MARRRYRHHQPLEEDISPLFACEIKNGIILTWMSFDPKYGPGSQTQIDWFTHQGYDTSEWKVGEPIKEVKFVE